MKNHSCISCYKEIDDNTEFMICNKCRSDVEFLLGDLCPKCGDKLNATGFCVNNCKINNYAFNSNISICYYTN